MIQHEPGAEGGRFFSVKLGLNLMSSIEAKEEIRNEQEVLSFDGKLNFQAEKGNTACKKVDESFHLVRCEILVHFLPTDCKKYNILLYLLQRHII